MQKHTFTLTATAVLGLALAGCANQMTDPHPGSREVALAKPNEVARCRQVGKTTASVTARIGLFSRSIDDIDHDLLRLARNSAVELGGDTVVPGERPDIGQRTFHVYKCAP